MNPAGHASSATTGFTLIEILVVIAIIAVLTAILLPSLHGASDTGRKRAAQLHANTVRLALNTTLANNPQVTTANYGNVDCTNAADFTTSGVVTTAGGNGWESAPQGMTCLATPATARTYRVTVTYDGTTATVP